MTSDCSFRVCRGRGWTRSHLEFTSDESCRSGRGDAYCSESKPWRPTVSKAMERELTKPWVKYHLRQEIRLKYHLMEVSGKTKSATDFDCFVKQRESVKNQTKREMEAFFRCNPMQERQWLPILALEKAEASYNCDVCDREFSSEPELLNHESQHEVCSLDGCTFIASRKQLELHILHLHSSGLYNRIPQTKNPQEINRWREERKKNYPTSVRTARAKRLKETRFGRKQNYLELLQKRRETYVEQMKSRRKNSAKNSVVKRPLRKRSARNGVKFKKDGSLEKFRGVDEQQWRDSGEETDDEALPAWFGNIQKFPGTAVFKSVAAEQASDENMECLAQSDLDISDDEWLNDACQEVSEKKTLEITNDKILDASHSDRDLFPTTAANTKPSDVHFVQMSPKSSLERGEYDERCLPITTERIKDDKAVEKCSSEDEAPDETPILKSNPEDGVRCFHDGSSGVHPVKTTAESDGNLKNFNNRNTLQRQKYLKTQRFVKNHRRYPPTLLEKLLKDEIEREKSMLLQCVRYVCTHNFFGIGAAMQENIYPKY